MYIPEILEGDARGRMRNLYHNIKATLRAPLVHDVFRVLAHYPAFLTYALEVSRPNLLSLTFENLAGELRAVPPPDAPLSPLPSAIRSRDLRGASAVLPVFRYLNAKLLLLTTAWYEALSERPILGLPTDETFIPPGFLPVFSKHIHLIRLDTAPPQIRQLLQSITDTHRGFVPSSDFRALAQYPTFLSAAWQRIQPHVDTPWHRDTTQRLLQRAQTLAHHLPYPIPLAPARLLTMMSEREIASCLAIVAMFRQLLPELIIAVELMAQLLAEKREA